MNRFDLCARYGPFSLAACGSWNASSVALFGASGSGKSTVLEAIAGLRRDVVGAVEIAGRRIEHLPARDRHLGWVPQDAALFPHLSVAENIEFGRSSSTRKSRGRSLSGVPEEALHALEIEGLLDRRAAELSGGERQRVAIARALASNPELLLLDEPLASIDRPLRARLLPYLQGLPERSGVPLILVTHDPLEVLSLVEEVLVIEAGSIVASGTPQEIFASAATFGALNAIGAENRFDVRITERSSSILTLTTSNGCTLKMVRVPGFPDPARVALRAEDVLLAREHPGVVSAQNVFEAEVSALEPVGEQVTVTLTAQGEIWRVRVTPRAATSLDLGVGRSVYLLIKAHAIVPA